MKSSLAPLLACIFSLLLATGSIAQEKEFEQLSLIPKTNTDFPLDYKIARPRLAYPDWDRDFDKYYMYLTPALRKTQASLSYNQDGVVSTMTPNSIIPHAQLDTATIAPDKEQLTGTWRMLKFRSILFNDSVDVPTKTYYRLADTLLDDKSNDEAFAVFTDNQFKLYAKEAGKDKFKRVMSSKYKVENRRYMMLYKIAKSAAGVSQFGIDEKGYLILNYPKVIENVKQGAYFSYYAVIEQYIFEKVK